MTRPDKKKSWINSLNEKDFKELVALTSKELPDGYTEITFKSKTGHISKWRGKLTNPEDRRTLEKLKGGKAELHLTPQTALKDLTVTEIEAGPPAQKKFYDIKDKPEPPLHKQARGYMKTTASLVGRDTSEERTLFDLPAFVKDTKLYRKVLSKNTAIAGHLCLAYWQRNKDDRGIYTITNLKHFADILGITPQELKIYLIYLGGYQYPIVKFNKETRILSIYHDKLFYIRFNIRLKENETENSFTADDKIGTNYLSFIRDRNIKSVEISPSKSLIEELKGKGLGNVLVSDSFVAFSLGLSDLAYKLFCLSGSNRPSFKIGFNKLISKKYLNLEEQVKGVYDKKGNRLRAGKGKPRILKRIKEALTELKDTGHLTKWAYDEVKDMFSWTYSSKIIKHKGLLPLKTGQMGQDKTGP